MQMLSRENEEQLFNEINILKDKWSREMNVKKNENSKNGSNTYSTYRIQLANSIYSSGQKAEVSGYFQIAVEQYRRANSLVPDIDRNWRLHSMVNDEMLANNAQIADPALSDGNINICSSNNLDDSADSRVSVLHLPDEILFFILRWVVGCDLDLFSLSIYALVCQKFLSVSRDEQLWRLICHRLWPSCSGLDLIIYGGSWFSMAKSRPHLLFHGCYLGSTSYVSEGEHSINRSNVPFILVRYFRVFRFRSDGTVIMATSAKHPQDIIKMMRLMESNRNAGELISSHHKGHYGIALGNYTVENDLIFVKLTRLTSASSHGSGMRGRNPGTEASQPDKHYLEMVFRIKPWKRRFNQALTWNSFSIGVERESAMVSVTHFDTRSSNYPTLVFSRVRGFCATLSQEKL